MPKVLTEAAVEQYGRDGYCMPFGLLEPEESAAMRGALERLEAERGGPRKDAFRIKGHLLLRWMTDLVRNPRLLDAVEDLIGPDILCWTSQWWIKEPHSPQFVSWHQDSNYWGLDTDHLVSAWVALSPATVESGCMRFMPGSHLGPRLPHRETWHDDNMLSRGQEISAGSTKPVPSTWRSPPVRRRSSRTASRMPLTPIAATTGASASPFATCRPTRARP